MASPERSAAFRPAALPMNRPMPKRMRGQGAAVVGKPLTLVRGVRDVGEGPEHGDAGESTVTKVESHTCLEAKAESSP